MSRLAPPSYAPHAIASPQGWMDPKTKEIYVAISGLILPNQSLSEIIEDVKETITDAVEDIAIATVEDKITDVVNDVKESITLVVEKSIEVVKETVEEVTTPKTAKTRKAKTAQ